MTTEGASQGTEFQPTSIGAYAPRPFTASLMTLRLTPVSRATRESGTPALTLARASSTCILCPPGAAATEAWLAALVADSAQVQLKGSTEGDMFSLNADAGWIGFLRP